MKREVTIYYLEITEPSQLRPKPPATEGLKIREARTRSAEFNRFPYTAVGGDWFWTDRLGRTYDEWQKWVDCPGLHTWVAYLAGTPAGYVELDSQPEGNAEIASFGLLPQFTG